MEIGKRSLSWRVGTKVCYGELSQET